MKDVIHPGQFLVEHMQRFNIDIKEICKRAGIHPTYLERLIKKKARIGVPANLKLGKLFGNSEFFWALAQAAWDKKEALKSDRLREKIGSMESLKETGDKKPPESPLP